MKKIVYFLLFILLIGCQRKILSHKSSSSNSLDALKINEGKLDSTMKPSYDSSLFSKDLAVYETGSDTIQSLSKYFEKNVCIPGNINHPKFLAFQKKSVEVLPEVREKLKSILTNSGQLNSIENCPTINPFKKKLGVIQRLDDCVFYPIPYYYLTFNVAERKSNDMNFLKFFSLDTLSIYYKVELVDEIIGIVKYSNSTAKISCFYPQDSLGIHKLKTLNKNAILIKKDLVNQGSSYQNFGYVEKNNLFFGECYSQELNQRNDETQESKIINHQGCDLILARDYYLKSTGTSNNLARIIKDGFISKSRLVK